MAIFFVAVSLAVAKSSGQFDMMDQLDKLDKQDFQAAIDKANNCTIMRNFSCSEDELRKAAKMANESNDKQTLNAANQRLQQEKKQVALEARIRAEQERERQRAEERRREEEERREREEEQMRRAQAEQQESSSSVNYAQAFAQGMNSKAGFYNDLDKIHNNAMQNINRTVQENKARAEGQRLANERTEADRRDRENERIRQQNQARMQLAQQQAEQRAQEQANERRAQQQLAAKQQEQELARQQQEQERKKEQARLQQEQERKQEQARKKAEAEAAKQAEAQAKKQAEEKYLQSMKAGIKLVATKCPDGEGKYYATGTRPHIKPEEVSCVDVHFRAYCPGNGNYTSGTARNFIGMSGCFGDTYEINPKPPCKIDQVRIEVEKVVPCN